MSRYDLTTPAGRFKARWDYVWKDHAFLRRWFMNAHWLGPDLVRTNQPSPRQLAYWKAQGIKTVAGNPDAIGYVSIGAAENDRAAGVPGP